jgi:hypothetical protein
MIAAREASVQFTFDVDGTRVEFSRNWLTGRCTLHTSRRDEVLQSSLNSFTHYSMKPKRQWHFSVGGHAVIIEKERPLLLAGLRPQTYRVFVDGKRVLKRNGF